MSNKDWLLCTIASASGESLTPAQLQKSLFLLGAERKQAVGRRFYKFTPYNYGPFCKEIYDDADSLREEGLLRITAAALPGTWSEYSATPEGLRTAEQIRDRLPADVLAYLDLVVAWTRSISFRQLILAIYSRYPKQRENSVFVP